MMQMDGSFADMSCKEQQDRWLEWRSRQLEYRQGDVVEPQETADAVVLPPVFPRPAPTRHSNLDQVWSRHRQASRRLGAFQPVTPSGGSGQ